jgi:hypothetical protein
MISSMVRTLIFITTQVTKKSVVFLRDSQSLVLGGNGFPPDPLQPSQNFLSVDVVTWKSVLVLE